MASLRREECDTAVEAERMEMEWAKAVAQARSNLSRIM